MLVRTSGVEVLATARGPEVPLGWRCDRRALHEGRSVVWVMPDGDFEVYEYDQALCARRPPLPRRHFAKGLSTAFLWIAVPLLALLLLVRALGGRRRRHSAESAPFEQLDLPEVE